MHGGIEMIKKILTVFLLCFISVSAFGRRVDFDTIYAISGISRSDIEKTLQDMFPDNTDKQAGIADSIHRYRDKKTGTITFAGFINICIENGITHCLENPEDPRCEGDSGSASIGYDTCMRFINTLYQNALNSFRFTKKHGYGGKNFTKAYCEDVGGDWIYSEVFQTHYCADKERYSIIFVSSCENDYDGKCVDMFNEIQVPFWTGVGLAKLWGRKNGYELTCDTGFSNRSTSTLDLAGQDYLRCSAKGEPFEFEFDKLEETADTTIINDTIKAICSVFGYEYFDPYLKAPGGCEVPTPIVICNNLAEYARSFGFAVERVGNQQRCYFYRERIQNLRTVYNIDNHVFQSEIQTILDSKLIGRLEDYVRSHLSSQNIELVSFTCNNGSAKSVEDFNDEVLTCYVNGNPVDFVFDDLSESFGYERNASNSQIDCIIMGGKLKGKTCRGPGKDECNKLNNQIDGGTKWDEESQACILKNVSKAQVFDTIISVSAGVAFVVVAAPVAGMSGVAQIVAVAVDAGFETAFLALQTLEQNYPNHVALEFLDAADNCDNKQCAQSILSKYGKSLENIANDLNDDQMTAVVQVFDRMSDYFTDEELASIIENGDISIEDFTITAGGPLLIAVGLFASPETALTKFANKSKRLANLFTQLGTHNIEMTRLTTLLRKYNKQAVLRLGSSNSLGRNYYRIMVNDNDDIAGLISDLQKNGYFISANRTKNGEKFIAASKENVFQKWNNRASNWLKNVDNVSRNINSNKRYFVNRNLESLLNYGDRPLPLGKIKGYDVFIDPKDFGQVSGRPIIMVSIYNKKIPFYISTGTAGKIKVPTGKWVFFGGIDPATGWFNKGDLDAINDHYGVPEFRQIANMLDSRIGDVRNVQLIAETEKRFQQGGQGIVAVIQDVKELDLRTINQSLSVTPAPSSTGGYALRQNIADLQNWFNRL